MLFAFCSSSRSLFFVLSCLYFLILLFLFSLICFSFYIYIYRKYRLHWKEVVSELLQAVAVTGCFSKNSRHMGKSLKCVTRRLNSFIVNSWWEPSSWHWQYCNEVAPSLCLEKNARHSANTTNTSSTALRYLVFCMEK